jgi:hypothetical protein
VPTQLNFNVLLDTNENTIAQSNSTDSIPNIIYGKVVEDGWDYSVKTSVIVKGTKIKTETDTSGYFKIVIPKNYKKSAITLLIKSKGFEDDTEITVQSSELPKHDLIFKKNPMIIGEIIIKRKKWWQFWE